MNSYFTNQSIDKSNPKANFTITNLYAHNNINIKNNEISGKDKNNGSMSHSKKNDNQIQVLKTEKLREIENNLTRNQNKEHVYFGTETINTNSIIKSIPESPSKKSKCINTIKKINYSKINNHMNTKLDYLISLKKPSYETNGNKIFFFFIYFYN